MTTNNNDLDAKLCSSFYCENCDYNTCKKSSFVKHCESKKHKNNDLTTINNDLVAKSCSEKKYICEKCVKTFGDRAGLWRHKKKCNIQDVNDTNVDLIDKDQLILMLVKQNSELIKETTDFKSMMMEQQNMMMEVIKNGTNISNNNINSHNKTFNLQFFLNETC